MNKNKLKKYRLTGSIHTLSVKSNGVVENVLDEVSECIRPHQNKKKIDQEVTTTSIINPNKLMEDLYSFGDFETAVDTILAGAGIAECKYTRIDMRFDSFELTHYKEFAKLNKYLLSVLAVTYKVKNTYRSEDLFSQEQLSIAIKNSYFEAENYDKNAESNGADKAESRLELRSKRLNSNDIPSEFLGKWFGRLDKAITELDSVHVKYNAALEHIYKSNVDKKPCRFRSVTDFLIQYQDSIFCKAQMIDLVARIGESKNPKASAEYYKRKIGLEYFSQKDIKVAVEEIKRATHEFFGR